MVFQAERDILSFLSVAYFMDILLLLKCRILLEISCGLLFQIML